MTGPITTAHQGIAPPVPRLPDETTLGAVRLQVAELDRSVGFYERVLGLAVIARRADAASLAARGERAAIVELVERRGARPVSRRGHLGLYHFAVLLPDRAALGRFLGHVAELGIQVGMSDHLVSEAIYLNDPDGLGIEVYADRPRADWRWADRQLTMSTLPLDAGSVLAAAGGERWTGAPAGTRIGHVHLHVGTIEGAESFYHDTIGFDKVVWSYPGALFLSAGGYHHHLGTNTWAAGAAPAADDDAKLLEWTIVLPSAGEVGEVADRVEGAGHPMRREGADVLATDPWGTVVRLRAATAESIA
ncbi:MAG TPA: VOC family protein [Gemmatimonadaceae bacterium]|nr:VOC family protein [Gemmatimonadaceae bacterium]